MHKNVRASLWLHVPWHGDAAAGWTRVAFLNMTDMSQSCHNLHIYSQLRDTDAFLQVIKLMMTLQTVGQVLSLMVELAYLVCKL